MVHVVDPRSGSAAVDALAARLTPRYRVLSLGLLATVAYQVAADYLLGVLRQFGFIRPVLIGEGLACVPVVLVGAWYPELVGRVILVDGTTTLSGDDVGARSLRDCPPNWEALRDGLRCPVLETSVADADWLDRVEAFLTAPLP